MLPMAYRGGTLRSAKDIAKIIHLTAKRRGDSVEVVFSCVAGHYDHNRDFEDLADAGISVRDTRWETVPRSKLDEGAAINNYWLKSDLLDSEYMQPLDGARQFSDCDFWLVVSDRLPRPIVPAAQYGVLTFDYIQRYVPEIFGDLAWDVQKNGYIPLVRKADFVLCTTDSTAADINAYAGVPRRKILQLPMFFECTSLAPAPRFMKDDYIVWVTNSTEHKNHHRVLHAVLRYYQSLGGTLKLLIVGPGTEVFVRPPADGAEYPYWVKCRDVICHHQELRANVSVEGEITEARYLSAVKNARFMLHPNLYDNGTFAVIDAALAGTPSLSARYPAMEFMNDTFRLNLTFFDPQNEKEMAQAMRDMEQKSRTIELPDRAFLETFSWRRNMDRVYDLIMARLNV